jgi:DNA-binding transcriptional LysR family regulator
MDIAILKTFLEVNRTRHFGQAADNLFLTQSAVSARIRLLEQTVGVPLFTRQRNNIELTPAGQKLLKHADSIINTWNRARQEIALGENAQIPLAVGGIPSLWDIFLQDWLNELCQRMPTLSVHAEVHNQEVLSRRIIEGNLDLGFMFESVQMQEIMVEEVGRIHLVMVSSQPEIPVETALKDNYVLVNWGTSFAIAHAQHFPDMPPPRLHVQIGRLAHAFLLNGGGSAYLAESMVRDDINAGRLFIVRNAPVIKRMAYAAFLASSDKKETLQEALQYINYRIG